MTPISRKKFVFCLTQGRSVSGFADPDALTSARFPALLADGQQVEIQHDQLLAAYAVNEFVAPERLAQPVPRGAIPLPGVRVRCRTTDHQNREGLLASDLLHLSQGVELTPLSSDSLWQRLYLPRPALEQFLVVEVVRGTRRRRQPIDKQFSLFSNGGPE